MLRMCRHNGTIYRYIITYKIIYSEGKLDAGQGHNTIYGMYNITVG
jgi:hypothetical protein